MFSLKLEHENEDEQPYEMKYEFLTVTNSTQELLNQRTQDEIDQTSPENSLRREIDKIRQRTKRALETEEQKAFRREQARLRAQRSRAEASEEERARRREIAKERKRIERAMETEEQTSRRREMAKQRIRLIRAMESDEEKEKRRIVARERIRMKRALEEEEEKVQNRQIAKERARRMRAMETEEQRQRRNEMGRERMRRKRTLELLRSCGYSDQQLMVLNHFMQTFGHIYDFSKNKLDFMKISEFFTEGEKRPNTGFEQTFSEHSLPKIEKREDEDLESVSQPGQSQDNPLQISSLFDPLDHRIIPPFIGKRITDIKYLFEQLQRISLHNLKNRCNFNCIRLVSEVVNGLQSEITLQCNNCDATFEICLNNDSDQTKLNVKAVSAAEAIGIGFMGLKTLSESIGLLTMTEDKYEEAYSQLSEDNAIFVKEERLSDEDNEEN